MDLTQSKYNRNSFLCSQNKTDFGFTLILSKCLSFSSYAQTHNLMLAKMLTRLLWFGNSLTAALVCVKRSALKFLQD